MGSDRYMKNLVRFSLIFFFFVGCCFVAKNCFFYLRTSEVSIFRYTSLKDAIDRGHEHRIPALLPNSANQILSYHEIDKGYVVIEFKVESKDFREIMKLMYPVNKDNWKSYALETVAFTNPQHSSLDWSKIKVCWKPVTSTIQSDRDSYEGYVFCDEKNMIFQFVIGRHILSPTLSELD